MTNGEHAPRVSDGHWCTRRRANVCKCAFAPRRTKSAACPGGRIRPRSRLVLAAPPRATTGRVRPGLWTRDVYCAVRRARSAFCTLGLGTAFQAPRQDCFDGDCARHGGSPTCPWGPRLPVEVEGRTEGGTAGRLELELELELERTQECENARSVCGALHTPPSLDMDVGERAGDRSGK